MSSSYDISKKEFELFKSLIYDEFGISLSDKKITLVQSRLRKWLQKDGFGTYKQLYEHLQNHTEELVFLADAITTNVTSFFREENQWVFLKNYLAKLQGVKTDRKLRIWSAGCSSGQEPYSIAMFLKETLTDIAYWDIKILATDLSHDILQKASNGVYREKDIEGMPKKYVTKYFHKRGGRNEAKEYVVNDFIKEMILFRSFNLVTGNYSIFKNHFDLIFCRNVMIYFDKPTQNSVIGRFSNLLRPGNLLLIGHSESITTTSHKLKLISSSIYEKVGV